MKAPRFLLLFYLLAGLNACDDFSLLPPPDALGELRWALDNGLPTKASTEIPDTNDFLLTIRDAGGTALYEGPYGDSPAYLPVQPGSYTLSIVSIPFSSPAFGRPQYGDEQVVVVPAGESVTVKLCCTLLNAGIRLRPSEGFFSAYPYATLYIRQDDTQLQYSRSETRIAYLMPREAGVVLYNDAQEETLFTRRLEPRQILTVSLSVPETGAAGNPAVKVAVDTTKQWTDEDYIIGGSQGNKGKSPEDAIPVPDAALHAGEKEVWVYGYIVGGDLTSNGKNVKTEGITKNTHLALAGRSSITEKAACVAVELPKGKLRDALNLVDHPELVGTRIYLKGNIEERYYGTTGLKGTSEYVPD